MPKHDTPALNHLEPERAQLVLVDVQGRLARLMHDSDAMIRAQATPFEREHPESPRRVVELSGHTGQVEQTRHPAGPHALHRAVPPLHQEIEFEHRPLRREVDHHLAGLQVEFAGQLVFHRPLPGGVAHGPVLHAAAPQIGRGEFERPLG